MAVMTLAGWIFMSVTWAVIIGVFSFCMSRTLRPGNQSKDADKQKSEL
jgi:hypothetical protein